MCDDPIRNHGEHIERQGPEKGDRKKGPGFTYYHSSTDPVQRRHEPTLTPQPAERTTRSFARVVSPPALILSDGPVLSMPKGSRFRFQSVSVLFALAGRRLTVITPVDYPISDQ